MDLLDELRGRVETLEAESQIRKLQAAYMEACDFHIGYPIGELFAPHGIWEGIGRFATGFGATRGREAVANQFESDKHRLPLAAHYLTNEQIWVKGGTARGKWMFLEPAVHERLGAILIAGRYDNDFVRLDGKWYIQHLRCDDIFVASYRAGWDGFPCLETGWIEERPGESPGGAEESRGGGETLAPLVAPERAFQARIYTPSEMGKPLGLYHQISRVRAAEFVFIAGQLSSDKDGNIVGKNDLKKQFAQILENIKTALLSQKLDFSHIVQFRTYLVDARLIEQFMTLRQHHFRELFPTGAFPPNTLLVVNRLVQEEFLIEIDVVAAA